MNVLNLGFHNKLALPKGGFIILTDEVLDIHRSKIFEPTEHRFNPLDGITEDEAEEQAELLYTLTPGGESTLKVRDGKLALAHALKDAGRFDKIEGNEEVRLMRDSILFSPIRRQVLCEPPNFKFSPDAKIQVHIDRKALSEKTALVLGLLLVAHYKGPQVIIRDLDFYGRDMHSRLIREERLIAGVSNLANLSPKLRRSVLQMEWKFITGTATTDDAELLAMYAKLEEKTIGYNDFVQRAIS